MKIKLIDENLVGQPGLSRYLDPETNWERFPENYDVNIYVDRLAYVSEIDTNKVICAWLIEPSIINGEYYINVVKNKDKFKYIFTHHKSILPQAENAVYIPHGGTWMRNEDIGLHEKNKLVSFIFSWKNWNSYHRMRFRVYDRLKEDNRVNLFGSGCEKPIDYKIEGLKEYKFSIVMENNIEPDYFTEKLIDCFLTGTVPIYLGPKQVENYFDPNGIIFFNGDEDLPNILNELTSELYDSKIESVKKNFDLAKQYMFPEQIIQKYLEDNV